VGVAAPEAYVRIVYYTVDIKNDSLFFAIEYHYNQQARNQNRNPIKGATYTVPDSILTGGGKLAAMYTYLKTLPEFAGAVDV
jgi:hypothetical protein